MKKLLSEVSIIRPVVIFLLVVMHAFTMHNGGWALPEGIDRVPVYAWLVKFITAFQIEAFALISGYVFAFQTLELGREYGFKGLMVKKFQRLMIPSLIFSLIYYFLLARSSYDFGSFAFFMKLSSGFGHMWFLPMLFWCFAVLWLVDHYKLYSKWFFIALAVLSLLNMPVLPFGMQRVFRYSFYCVLGYHLYRHKDRVISSRYLGWVSFFVYVALVVVTNTMSVESDFNYCLHKVLKLIMACGGIFALYILVGRHTSRDGYEPGAWVLKVSAWSYGVYIIHQFIMEYLYYRTDFPDIFGTYWLPWVVLVIALAVSIPGTMLLLKTRTGRFLLG